MKLDTGICHKIYFLCHIFNPSFQKEPENTSAGDVQKEGNHRYAVPNDQNMDYSKIFSTWLSSWEKNYVNMLVMQNSYSSLQKLVKLEGDSLHTQCRR
jgi:hypothetical protein